MENNLKQNQMINLFKGKLLHSNEWIEGNLIIARNGQPYIIPFEIFEPDGHHLIIDSDSAFWVDSKTICQFTGQVDKYGDKLFANTLFSNGWIPIEQVCPDNHSDYVCICKFKSGAYKLLYANRVKYYRCDYVGVGDYCVSWKPVDLESNVQLICE